VIRAGANQGLQPRRTAHAFAAFRAEARSTVIACLNPANAAIACQVNSRGGVVVSKCSASGGTETGAREAVEQLDQTAERPAAAVEPPDTQHVSGGAGFQRAASAPAHSDGAVSIWIAPGPRARATRGPRISLELVQPDHDDRGGWPPIEICRYCVGR